ncbi:hypothetical protein [Grimontia hollisae]|uniref:hypothetical protein n=1 Tax=Grimontia hollisae TaxID=673 RepID=UPI00165E37B4|nr:hypothetical protein [Grimontia hollisae]
MCGLCGMFGQEEHWLVTQTTNTSERNVRLRLRYERIKIINRWLIPFNIKVSDVHGASYLLCSPTGKQTLVSNVTELWMNAELLSGKTIDPLNISYLTHISNV